MALLMPKKVRRVLKINVFMVMGLFLLTPVCAATAVAQKWAAVTQVQQTNNPQSIGSYTAGCISGAVALPINGQGFQVMRLSRKRNFGHPNLTRFIEQLGLAAHNQQLGTLLIGDLGQPRGGPTLSGHRSHQTGLDVDIWFLLSKQAGQRVLSFSERETWGAPSVLAGHSDTLDFRQWRPEHEKVLELAASSPDVERIFVNPSIKRELCKRPTARAWLQKIRPWWKHDDHFHVRLKCPGNNPHCQRQEPLPAGDGCDAGLNWWFSEEAKHPKPPTTAPKPLVLPSLCEQVLQAP